MHNMSHVCFMWYSISLTADNNWFLKPNLNNEVRNTNVYDSNSCCIRFAQPYFETAGTVSPWHTDTFELFIAMIYCNCIFWELRNSLAECLAIDFSTIEQLPMFVDFQHKISVQAHQESNDKHKTILHDIFEKNNDSLPSDRPRASIRLKTIQSMSYSIHLFLYFVMPVVQFSWIGHLKPQSGFEKCQATILG